MPEGHTIHRAARDQRPGLVGRTLAVSSPQGRFAEGATRLDGHVCEAVEAYGKHLLYAFEHGLTLHIHLGLFGRIRLSEPPPGEPRGLVRVRLASEMLVVDINGPAACDLLEGPEVEALTARIGPDPLRSDADPDRAWARVRGSRAPIGLLLMDQAVMAGIGNIYRTELLWRQRIHPEQEGRTLDRADFGRLWADAKRLLQIGVERNAIVTRNEGRAPARTFKGRVNVFKKTTCPRCSGAVRAFEQAGRKVFACETCAPPPEAAP